MLRIYSERRIEALLGEQRGWIETVSRWCGVPAACIRAVLRREMALTDLLDPVADAAVALYWRRWGIRSALCRAGLVRSPAPRLVKGPLGKRDSSTGYGQIFAYVAINAANYGEDRGLDVYRWLGLTAGERMDPKRPEDLCRMWRTLRRDRRVNIALSALNIAAAGAEVNGHADFERYTPEELQRAFTRYNANVRTITPYGRAVYDLYCREQNDTGGIENGSV